MREFRCKAQPEVRNHDVWLVSKLILAIVQRDVGDLEVGRVRGRRSQLRRSVDHDVADFELETTGEGIISNGERNLVDSKVKKTENRLMIGVIELLILVEESTVSLAVIRY